MGNNILLERSKNGRNWFCSHNSALHEKLSGWVGVSLACAATVEWRECDNHLCTNSSSCKQREEANVCPNIKHCVSRLQAYAVLQITLLLVDLVIQEEEVVATYVGGPQAVG